MSRFYSHLNTARSILNLYKGEVPFSVFLKNFFAKEKKYGSRDRKNISSLCYNYFRLGWAGTGRTIDEQLLTALFLLNDAPNEWLQNEKSDWNDRVHLPFAEKLTLANLDVRNIFPLSNELSQEIDVTQFNLSFLIQPDLYIRIRPGKENSVRNKLSRAQVAFREINENCLAFANGTRVEDFIEVNREAVIQDLSSQGVGELVPVEDLQKGARVWDCCAASGGKSIMTYDLISQIELTVSDVRQSIIHNLHVRFKEAGIKNYHSFVADLTKPASLASSVVISTFDLIICDAPCSGSGTWSRTPEQLLFFKPEEITRYSNLQKSITAATVPYLKKKGYFLYITCSVFEKENEEVVKFIERNSDLELLKMKLIKGYDIKADTMFAALFQLK